MLATYCTDAFGLPQSVFDRWISRIAPGKAERLQRICPEQAKVSMTGELLLRYGMWKTFGIVPSELKTVVDHNGKPQVASHSGVHFNISHTGTLCLCAVADRPVGADIQAIRPVRHEQLAARYFSQQEQAQYRLAGATQEAFFTVWARKEALGKLTGRGLRPGEDGPYVIALEKNFQNCKICVITRP